MASHQVLTLAGSGGCHKDPTPRTFATGVPGARRPGAGAHPAGAGLWPPRKKNTRKTSKKQPQKQKETQHTQNVFFVFSFLGNNKQEQVVFLGFGGNGCDLFSSDPPPKSGFPVGFPSPPPPPHPSKKQVASKQGLIQTAMGAPSIANKYRGFLVRLLAIYFLGVNYTTWFPMPTTYPFRFGEIFGRDKDYSPQMCGQCNQSKEPVLCFVFFPGPRYLRTTHWPTSHATCLSCIFRYHFGSF